MNLNIETSRRIELIDITSEVKEEVRISGVREGVCIISTRHTTAGIIVNENENGLREDILNMLERLVPQGGAGYRHDRIDNNADSHLKAILLGSSEALPIIKGELELGTWQSIFLPKWTGQGTGR